MINYIEITYDIVQQITQGKMGFAKVTFAQLESIVRFTAREEETSDPLEESSEIDKVKAENQRFYQRLTKDDRTAKIQNFIVEEAIKEYRYKKGLSKKTSLGLFPTSTLLAINIYPAASKEEYENEYYLNEKKTGNKVNFCYHEGNTLFLPQGNEIALVVDGQHRIAALRELYYKVNENLKHDGKNILNTVDSSFIPFLRERIKNFEFLCTILIDFNLYEQGQIFASVNFNQKPVNRSLYYDIFGSSPNIERNELKLAHDLVSHLNYNENSPLKGLIDMLGNGNGIVSQSAVLESIKKLFGNQKVWNILYMDYRNNGEKYKSLGLYLRLYFQQIKNTFPEYWPSSNNRRQYPYILLKTTGVGAFMRLANDIFKEIDPHFSKTQEEIKNQLKEKFDKIAKNGKLYFDSNSEFVKGAGQGLQSKLYKKLVSDLS